MRLTTRLRILAVVPALGMVMLSGCAAAPEELPNDEFACPHFAAVNEKLSVNYLDDSAQAQQNWDEAGASLDDTIEMANGDVRGLVEAARQALPSSPLGDVSEYDRVVADLAAACELPDGFDIDQLER